MISAQTDLPTLTLFDRYNLADQCIHDISDIMHLNIIILCQQYEHLLHLAKNLFNVTRCNRDISDGYIR